MSHQAEHHRPAASDRIPTDNDKSKSDQRILAKSNQHPKPKMSEAPRHIRNSCLQNQRTQVRESPDHHDDNRYAKRSHPPMLRNILRDQIAHHHINHDGDQRIRQGSPYKSPYTTRERWRNHNLSGSPSIQLTIRQRMFHVRAQRSQDHGDKNLYWFKNPIQQTWRIREKQRPDKIATGPHR